MIPAPVMQLNRDLEQTLYVLEEGTPLLGRVAVSLNTHPNLPALDRALTQDASVSAPKTVQLCMHMWYLYVVLPDVRCMLGLLLHMIEQSSP